MFFILPRAAVAAATFAAFAASPAAAQHTHEGMERPDAPYAGLEEREIKALSADEVQALLDGEGMGLALAAELNGLPGPLHVLELADSLELTVEQRESVSAIFDRMKASTRELGARLVEAERTLDRRFLHRHVDPETVDELTRGIALLYGEIRAAHLKAHLEVLPLLTEAQTERYRRLRGYDTNHR